MVIHGDCRVELPKLDQLFHACVCDPPYNLTSIQKRFGSPDAAPARGAVFARSVAGFMGKSWDSDVAFDPATWRLVYDRLLPGAHLLAFGGTRTHHRLMCAIEDAGFEIRDCLGWVYGNGFPKSHDVSKAIDKYLDAEREVVGQSRDKCYHPSVTAGASIGGNQGGYNYQSTHSITAPATPEAKQWEGWGSALKPAYEPIILARKPLDGTLAENTLKHGVGGLNIAACRVPAPDQGRFPANLIHDGSDEVLDLFPQTNSTAQPRHNKARPASAAKGSDSAHVAHGYDDQGSAARFFYCSKASKHERAGGSHPTVKPLALMRYLCRLICPPGGIILDPFAGSGSTGVAAMQEGFDFVGIELEADYIAIAERRLTAA